MKGHLNNEKRVQDDRDTRTTQDENAFSAKSNDHLSILVLGDGDFSYSYDLARYLAIKASANPPMRAKMLDFVTTGLDSSEALNEKYKDATFLVKNLKTLDNPKEGLKVTVHHGINALRNALPMGFQRAQHVLFNHPHLGEEDAMLHSQFLCHLLHAVSNVWMIQDGGFFHITLVTGQFERWKCHDAANRSGMQLFAKHSFRSPGPYYQQRRHQTGKSFAARTPKGSETYTFARKPQGKSHSSYYSQADSLFLTALLDLTTTSDIDTNTEAGLFECPHCEKSFKEERSRKNHIKSVHRDGDKKRKRQLDQTFCCHSCESDDGTGPRVFQSVQALEDHRTAKHFAKHPLIRPDWHSPEKTSPDRSHDSKSRNDNAITGNCCDICGASFSSEETMKDHLRSFVPSDVTTSGSRRDLLLYKCIYCKKSFREERAQKQHENFCRSRTLLF